MKRHYLHVSFNGNVKAYIESVNDFVVENDEPGDFLVEISKPKPKDIDTDYKLVNYFKTLIKRK